MDSRGETEMGIGNKRTSVISELKEQKFKVR